MSWGGVRLEQNSSFQQEDPVCRLGSVCSSAGTVANGGESVIKLHWMHYVLLLVILLKQNA